MQPVEVRAKRRHSGAGRDDGLGVLAREKDIFHASSV